MDTVLQMGHARCVLHCAKVGDLFHFTINKFFSSSIFKSETAKILALCPLVFMFYSFKVFILQHICVNILSSVTDRNTKIPSNDGKTIV